MLTEVSAVTCEVMLRLGRVSRVAVSRSPVRVRVALCSELSRGKGPHATTVQFTPDSNISASLSNAR